MRVSKTKNCRFFNGLESIFENVISIGICKTCILTIRYVFAWAGIQLNLPINTGPESLAHIYIGDIFYADSKR